MLAIKQTLYRTSGDSPIVDALIDAAQAGKQVLAIVEIKARFDEQNNIEWARKLEEAGVHVVYGLVGLKTHSKLSMVVRDDGDQLRRYCHIGTGNYHPKTARLYEDLGLLTCDPAVGEDVSNLFNVLSGYSMNTDYERFLVAPHSVRTGLVERIEREVENHKAGLPVRHPLQVQLDRRRGHHRRPLPGIARRRAASTSGSAASARCDRACPASARTSASSASSGRFLEHSRAYCFENAGNREVWIGSADLMHRNLDRRVETLIRLVDPEETADIYSLFDYAYDPETSAWDLEPDGTWTRRLFDADGRHLRDYQESLLEIKRKRGFAP